MNFFENIGSYISKRIERSFYRSKLSFNVEHKTMQVLVAVNIFRNSKKSEDIVQNIGKVSIKQESGEESGASLKCDNERSKQNRGCIMASNPSRHVAAVVSISRLTKVRHTNRQSPVKIALRFTCKQRRR